MTHRPDAQDRIIHGGLGGHARLLVSSADRRFVFDLVDDVTTIGSGVECVLQLPDAGVREARVSAEADGYVLRRRLTDAPIPLRTGARFTAGPWTLVFVDADAPTRAERDTSRPDENGQAPREPRRTG